MVYTCRLIDWTFVPEGKKLRSNNRLECTNENTKYVFSETNVKYEAFHIYMKSDYETKEIDFFCFECVEALKEFLNSDEDHTICNCIGRLQSLYEFQKLENGDIRIGSTNVIGEKEIIKTLDIDSSLVQSVKNFLNEHHWDIGNIETIRNGLDIIREKIENCDLSVLGYVKLISSEMEIGLFEKKITLDDYNEINDRLFRLIERFKTNCMTK